VRHELQMPIVAGTWLDAQLKAERFDLLVVLAYLEPDARPPARAVRGAPGAEAGLT
jgi:hypothetical protein